MAKSEISSENNMPSLKISRKNPANVKRITDSSKPIRSISKAQAEAKKKKSNVVASAPVVSNSDIDETISVTDNTIAITPMNKRNLRLNTESLKPQEVVDKNVVTTISYVKDTSVNQNSPFFSEPSIFEKFAIDVTETEDEIVEKVERNEDTIEIINEVITEEEQQPILHKMSSEELVQANTNIIEEMLESIINEEPVEEKVEIVDEVEVKEAADSIAVGKFFDSSIPAMDVKQEFTPIDKTLLTPHTSIFKNFTYEEADIVNSSFVNHENDDEIKIESVIANTQSQIQPSITEEKPLTIESLLSNNDVVPAIEEKADIQTLLVPTVEQEAEAIFPVVKDEVEEVAIDYTNIITPESATSLNIDDIDLEDIELEDLEILDDEVVLEEDVTEQEEVIEEKVEDTTEEVVEEQVVDTLEELSDDEVNELMNAELGIIADEEIDDTEKDEIKVDDEIDYSDVQIENEYNDEDFNIEDYFGINDIDDSEELTAPIFSDEDDEQVDETEEIEEKVEEVVEDVVEDIIEEEPIAAYEDEIGEFSIKTDANQEITNLTELIRNFTQTISTLNNRIADLETGKLALVNHEEVATVEDVKEEAVSPIETVKDESKVITADEVNIDDISLEDIDITDLEESIEELDDIIPEEESIIDLSIADEEISLEDLEDVAISDEDLEASLLEEMLAQNITEEELGSVLEEESFSPTPVAVKKFEYIDQDENVITLNAAPETEATSDLYKILDTLSKTITELESASDAPAVEENQVVFNTNSDLPKELLGNDTFEDGKEINILINKDDIFSISIINETYEIVADFDGISVLSENIHISTPKNNFYVKIGEKYIEIHKQQDQYLVQTNFEDIEFANAINNVGFAKKNNKLELNIKEAFKLSSVNNKIELSMLNTAIADIAGINNKEESSESSICDNKTLLISEETQKVYLPYTIEEVMKKLNDSNEYQSLEEVISKEYTLPLSTFKVPVISRFKEAYKFMREKEKSSRYAAMDLGLELMFNSNLNPAIIRAAKDLKELNIYLDCLYENEVEKFDCFKIVYKVLPKIQ